MRLFLFRHGETDWNAEGRFQGHIDRPLNENGRSQARALADPLARHGLEVILSSDLQRAAETAALIAETLGVPVIAEAGLREAHLGEAQGLTYAEIHARFGGELVTRWRSSELTDADVSYPGGETGIQVQARAFAAIERFVHRHPFERVGISTHGGVIRRIMQRILPPNSDPVPIPNGVLYVIEYDTTERKFRWEKQP